MLLKMSLIKPVIQGLLSEKAKTQNNARFQTTSLHLGTSKYKKYSIIFCGVDDTRALGYGLAFRPTPQDWMD